MKLALHFIFIHLKMMVFGVAGAAVISAATLIVSDGIKLHSAGVPVLPLSGFFSK